jgi:hypothetical protein
MSEQRIADQPDDDWPDQLTDEEWDDYVERYEAEREERVKTLLRRFTWVAREAQSLWGKRHAHKVLSDAIEHFKPPRQKKSRLYPKLDDALLAAHRNAPVGKKMASVVALGAKNGLSGEATRQRLRRRLRDERAMECGFQELLKGG